MTKLEFFEKVFYLAEDEWGHVLPEGLGITKEEILELKNEIIETLKKEIS